MKTNMVHEFWTEQININHSHESLYHAVLQFVTDNPSVTWINYADPPIEKINPLNSVFDKPDQIGNFHGHEEAVCNYLEKLYWDLEGETWLKNQT